MSEKKSIDKRISLIVPFIAVIVTFSILLVFWDGISSKPTEAGFWMILTFGASLGVALTLTLMQIVSRKKP